MRTCMSLESSKPGESYSGRIPGIWGLPPTAAPAAVGFREPASVSGSLRVEALSPRRPRAGAPRRVLPLAAGYAAPRRLSCERLACHRHAGSRSAAISPVLAIALGECGAEDVDHALDELRVRRSGRQARARDIRMQRDAGSSASSSRGSTRSRPQREASPRERIRGQLVRSDAKRGRPCARDPRNRCDGVTDECRSAGRARSAPCNEQQSDQ